MWSYATCWQVFCTLVSIRALYELRRLHHPDLNCSKSTRVCRGSSCSSAAMEGGVVFEYSIHSIFLHDFCDHSVLLDRHSRQQFILLSHRSDSCLLM